MATTTPNYGWPVPTSTDYVKDGATAIEALGDAIDATVFGLPSGALTLISTTTIGTAVSSVNVTGAFSATYDNYKIVVSGGVASSASSIGLKMGATTTGYYSGTVLRTFAGTTSGRSNDNAASWLFLTAASTDVIPFMVDVMNPFLSKFTLIDYMYIDVATNGDGGHGSGVLRNTTSYTDFTLTPNSPGTLTGGTIYVYGYAKV